MKPPNLSPFARILTVAAMGAIGLAILLSGGDDEGGLGPADDPGRTRSTTEFTDSIGVVMHLAFLDTAYVRQTQVFARLRELGVEHIRDGAPVNAPGLARGLRQAARLGVRGTLVTDLNASPEASVAAGLREMGTHVEAFEAPNELDVTGPPDWEQRLDAYLPPLRAAANLQRPRVRIVGPSFVDAAYLEGIDPGTFDVGSIHPYAGGLPPENPLREQYRRALDIAPGKRIAFTETGYHNATAATEGQPPASEEAAAVYLPRALLTAFDLGVERTFIYELVDEQADPGLVDPERHFGLLRHDFSPKPAFLAVQNLIAAARNSPGPAQGSPPTTSVDSGARVERVDLTRPDGSRLVALWRPAVVWDRDARRAIQPRPATVRLTWPRPARDLSVLRPTAGAEPVQRQATADSLALELEGDVVLLSYR